MNFYYPGPGQFQYTALDSERDERGFSLIEGLVAIIIQAVGLLSLARMMGIATSSDALAWRMTASAALAKEQLELLKAASFYTGPANLTAASHESRATGGRRSRLELGRRLSGLRPRHAARQFVGRHDLHRPLTGGAERTAGRRGGGSGLPLEKLMITVRCLGTGNAYPFIGDARLTTSRTANVDRA